MRFRVLQRSAETARSTFYAFVIVSAAILFFALAIRPLGVIVTAFASFMIAALGTHETRWIEAVIVGACLTAGCAILFPYILGLPMPMLPRFLVQ
jgi:hypothetical protein